MIDGQGARIQRLPDASFSVISTPLSSTSNGEQAVQKANAKMYDVILMDLHMPVMDGYTASKVIRGFNQETPIIALTASTDFKEKQMQDSGLNDFLQKPFKPNELYDMICKYASN